MLEPRPVSGAEAVERAQALLANPSNASTGYYLGTGNYHPVSIAGRWVDVPWTQATDAAGAVHVGCDCAGLICYAYKLPRHRPGYNRGGGYDVEDDINCNSMLGDAMGARDCFELVNGDPQPGDVIAYPSFYLYGADGKRLQREDGSAMHWIGHTALVVGVSRWAGGQRWDTLDVIQVKGPNGRMPAAIATDGSIWLHHDETWPKPQHRSYLMRAVP